MTTIEHTSTAIITAIKASKGNLPLVLVRNGINMKVKGVYVMGPAINIIVDGRQFIPLEASDEIQDPNN